jgi:outer membrane protein
LQEVLPLVEPDPDSAQAWVDMALQSNPAVISSRAAVDVAEANMRLARSGHIPTLDLIASYNQFKNNEFVFRDFDEDGNISEFNSSSTTDDTQVRLLLDIPIYQGGRVTAQTRQARYYLDATGQDLDDIQRGVVRQAQNTYRAVLAGIQEVQAFEQATISAESALEATQAGFEVGTRTIVDVLISEQRKYQAKRDNSIARHAYIINHLRLKRVAGLLSAEDLQIVNGLLK